MSFVYTNPKPLIRALPPRQYDFRNWDLFKKDALRYHMATHPDDDLVIDRIATFRSYMSARVVQHLGSLLSLHPRYNSTEGWNEWILAATDALRSQDETIRDLPQNPFRDPTAAEAWVEKFRSSEINEGELWEELDLLASGGDITADEQRQFFWDAHSWNQQQSLVEKCQFFDPRDTVWLESERHPDRITAEQLLNRVMSLARLERKVDSYRKIAITLCVIGGILVIVGIILLSCLAIRRQRRRRKIVLACLGICFIAISFGCWPTALAFYIDAWRSRHILMKARVRIQM